MTLADRHGLTDDNGFLAIWSDVTPEQATDYLHWLTREHTHERLGVEGFLGVSVFRAQRDDAHRYFIRYRLRDAGVLSSDAYVARLNDPTPWSRRIMPILQNFVRGGGHVRTRHRTGHGGTLSVLRLDALPAAAVVADLSRQDGIVAAELLETDRTGTTIQTNEKQLRSGDKTFAALLVVEGTSAAAVTAALGSAGLAAPDELYALVFHM